MLISIESSVFRHGLVAFKPGLNVVLGDENATNSIGKSSLLMIVDFAFGGSDLLKKMPGIAANMGDHFYDFVFEFSGERYCFRRSTRKPSKVSQFSARFSVPVRELTLSAYTSWLADQYGVGEYSSSFRDLVSPFTRVWLRDTFQISHPLQVANRESVEKQLIRTLRLFGRFGEIEELVTERDAAESALEALRAAIKGGVLTKVSAATYRANKKRIYAAQDELSAVKSSFATVTIALQDAIHQQASELAVEKGQLLDARERALLRRSVLSQNLLRSAPPPSAALVALQQIVPSVNVERLAKIEEFHTGVARIMRTQIERAKVEVDENLASFERHLRDINGRISSMAQRIQAPPGIVERIVEITSTIRKHEAENESYERLQGAIARERDAVDALVAGRRSRLDEIAAILNVALSAIATAVFPSGAARPVIDFTPTDYVLSCKDDTGTGSAYAGLLLFDLVILSATVLPFLVEDSPLFKNIATPVIEQILSEYAASQKQIFIAIDERMKFSENVQTLLIDRCVLSLDRENLLFTKDWRNAKDSN